MGTFGHAIPALYSCHLISIILTESGGPNTKEAGPEREITSTKPHSFSGHRSVCFLLLPAWPLSLSPDLGATQGLGIWHA